MKTISTFARITEDRVLRLEVPCGLSPGLAEVTLVVQPTDTESVVENGPPYRSLYGIWADKFPDIDVDADLQEMNQMWKKILEVSE
ncbi:MAG: hypothetical protein O7E52_01015 [Candidatus Poribacteria bacterium]|nr:hypothetical protein [Candidatus Poribacteria bacterium]